MFKPGDEVICVDASVSGPHGHGVNHMYRPSDFSSWLVEGQVYTIRGYGLRETAGVLLEEIIGPYNPVWDGEQMLAALRFRKVQKTDISIFEQFKKTKIRERELTNA
jgi:hypothetical protein